MFALALIAQADPTGSNYGGINAITAATAGAPTLAEVAADAGTTKTALNFFFLIVGVGLIFFMQAGFMLVETGFCRSKHAAHVAMTNFVIFAVGALAYWAVGFGLQFGSLGAFYWAPGAEGLLTGEAVKFGANAFAGTKGFLLGSLGDGTYDPGVMAFFLFQLVFMDTAATIVTGGMAERWKFSAFIPFGVFMAVVVYPLYGMWIWGGGWLATLGANYGIGNGAVDFAGSSVVHAVGGFAALAGAMVLGPRIGKFKKDGTPVALPGHNIPMAILGTIILVFGWFGFNGMSTLAATDLRFTVIIANTMLAGAAGCLAAMFLVWKLWGKPDPSMAVNGMLAGLVAITAPCAFVTPWASVIIGTLGRLPRRRLGRLRRARAQGRRPGRRGLGPRRERRVGHDRPRPVRRRHLRRRLERRRSRRDRPVLRQRGPAPGPGHRRRDGVRVVVRYALRVLQGPRRHPGHPLLRGRRARGSRSFRDGRARLPRHGRLGPHRRGRTWLHLDRRLPSAPESCRE